MYRRMALFLIFIFCLVSLAFADEVVLKSGKKIVGNITFRDDSMIKIMDPELGVDILYFREDIDTINGQKMQPAAQAPAQETNVAVPVMQEAKSEPEKTDVDIVGRTQERKVAPEIKSQYQSFARSSGKKLKIPPQVLLLVIIIFVIFSLLSYVYGALCLFFIANKTATTPAWMAWVPIANLFLICKIINVPYWYLLGYLLGFIPYYIGTICSLVLLGFFWFKIAQARGKPGWVGILVCFPLVGLVVMGYLAFSE